MDESNRKLARGISVVVPVYNSEGTLESLVSRLEDVLRQIGRDFELLLVNDGSRDGSWGVVSRLAESRATWVRGINLMRNYGQHNALLCGIRAARFDVTVTLDDDLQHPPEHIPRLLEKLEDGFDVVYGAPEKPSHTWLRNVFSRATKTILGRAMGLPTIVNIGAFRVFHTAGRDAFRDFASPNPMIDILLSWGTSKFTSISVPHEPRLIGASNYTLGKLINQAMLLITGFTTAPLRAASLTGFLFTLFGILVFVWVLVRYLLHGSIPGFPFLASIISLFSGAQLFALGIGGEYLARIFNRSMDRPAYVVRQTTYIKAAEGRGATAAGGDIDMSAPRQQVVRADVTLRPIGSDDAPAMLRWISDPLVAANVGVRASPSMEKTREWIARSAADASMLSRAILLNGAHVGNVVLDRIDEHLRSARLSIYVGEPTARGKGVASGAINLVLAEAFVRLHLNKVWLTVHCKNAAAIRTYVRLGFVTEGVLRHEFVLNGEHLDLLYMGLLADEFARSRA